ncbi:hypothetical protein QE403_000346 [Chryseobacterium sp. SORGH_AS 1048]|nr:hypothetical protein [Chryseobacterium sp. SORGH_AS_1048]
MMLKGMLLPTTDIEPVMAAGAIVVSGAWVE